MKNIKTILFLLMCTVLQLSASQTPTTWQRIKNWAYSTPLFAGWRHSEAEKHAARKKIQELLIAREQAHDQLVTNQGLSDQEKARLKKQITDLDAQIHAQKIITGQKWTRTRRAVATLSTGALLLGAGTITKYKSMNKSISPETTTPQNPNKHILTPLYANYQDQWFEVLSSPIRETLGNVYSPATIDNWNLSDSAININFKTKYLHNKNAIPTQSGRYVWATWNLDTKQFMYEDTDIADVP